MFEHLDDRLPPVGLLADPSFADVRERMRSVRRRQNIVVTTLTLSLVATGGVCGLSLGGPDSVHAPIGKGRLLAIGDPQSLATNLPPAQLTGSDRTSTTMCPTSLDPHHPVGFSAAAVTDPAPAGLPPAGGGSSAGAVDSPSAWGGAVASIAAGASGSSPVTGGGGATTSSPGAPAGSGSGGAPRPVVDPRPTYPAPPVGTSGGVPVPPPTNPPVTPPPVTTPPVGTGGGGSDPGSGNPGSGDPGAGNPGAGDPGTGNPGTGDPGSGDPGSGSNPGSGDPSTGPTGTPTGTPTGDPGAGTPAPDPTDLEPIVEQIFSS